MYFYLLGNIYLLSQREILLGCLMAVSYVPGMIFCGRWFARMHVANHQSDITYVMRSGFLFFVLMNI